ncbi:hypothetical protein VP01_3310g2, partial [Puccinia sorghi]
MSVSVRQSNVRVSMPSKYLARALMLAVLVGGLAIQVNSSRGVMTVQRWCDGCRADRAMNSFYAPLACGARWICPAGCGHGSCSIMLDHWELVCTTCTSSALAQVISNSDHNKQPAESNSNSSPTIQDSSFCLCPIQISSHYTKDTKKPQPNPFPSPFINKSSYFYSKFLTNYLSKLPLQDSLVDNKTHIPPMEPANHSTETSAKAKFLCKPIKYKLAMEPLLADGSNLNKWKRDLNMVIRCGAYIGKGVT